MAKELYKKARVLNDKVTLTGGDDPVMTKESTAEIKRLTANASRLERIAAGEAVHRFREGGGPRRVMRGDSVTVKTMHEKAGVAEWDCGLSDDESEGRTEDDTDEGWRTKVSSRTLSKKESTILKNKFKLNETVQGRYRQVLHTRRPKDIVVGTARIVTNFSVFER